METIFLIFLLNFLHTVLSQTIINCNGEAIFSRAAEVRTINYPEAVVSAQQPPTCTYNAKSPTGTFITATITHNISGTEPTCPTQRIWVARDGSTSFAGGSFFCGFRQTTPLKISSIGNELSIAFQSSTVSGSMKVTLQSVAPTATNCDCSWNPTAKIVNGEYD
jgi:CUB domain